MCKHYFTKVHGMWVCDCGEWRDRYGRTVMPSIAE